MYQVMYVEKNFTLMGVFTYFGIGIFIFGFFLRSTKSAALDSVGLPIKERANRNRGDEIETIPNKSAFLLGTQAVSGINH